VLVAVKKYPLRQVAGAVADEQVAAPVPHEVQVTTLLTVA